jgi:hypothetical protein
LDIVRCVADEHRVAIGKPDARPLKQERADQAVEWPVSDPDGTTVLPALPPDESDEPKTVPHNVFLFVSRLPARTRPYNDNHHRARILSYCNAYATA